MIIKGTSCLTTVEYVCAIIMHLAEHVAHALSVNTCIALQEYNVIWQNSAEVLRHEWPTQIHKAAKRDETVVSVYVYIYKASQPRGRASGSRAYGRHEMHSE